MKNQSTSIICIAALLLFVNAGFQSTGSKESPGVNFYGTVQVNSDTNQAENITISHLYENIKMYGIPASAETAPTTNVTFMRLDDIREIAGLPTGQNIKTFKQRDYVEISVHLASGQTKRYLVERARKLYYDLPVSDPSVEPLEREVAMEAVKKVVIKGYKQQSRRPQAQPRKTGSAAQEALCIQAKKDIAELEKESPNSFNKLIESIKESIYYLCS